jgi:hypothetical protein
MGSAALALDPATAAAGSAVADAVSLADIADRLAALLTRETAFVRAMQIKEIGPLQGEKAQLTREYQRLLKGLAGATLKLPAELKMRAMRAGQRLADAAVENERILRVGQAATDRLIAAIAAAIKRQRPPTTGYAPRKGMPPRMAAVAGIAIDRRL